MAVSPYFECLFGPHFSEGHALKREVRPEIRLEEDDPEAMGIILSVLHYQAIESLNNISISLLAQVARASDKYDATSRYLLGSSGGYGHLAILSMLRNMVYYCWPHFCLGLRMNGRLSRLRR
ncbi:hypothetical protein CKAH01_16378 [Colletotrichum kahawae]|uniref:BTB domain-containing protein n=1 Tax=Colletotrichum kahawae TaxID=34407 RepID=A0AAD9YFR7_COLKA|nr:hypothetical protein CKAH01_16378 [Colletotrichum kahawae]